MHSEVLLIATIFLAAMALAVPTSKKLGFGSVLGYLLAGLALAPVFRLLGVDTVALQHAAEFGVVFMLFLVGLELAPQTFWNMRRDILGFGGAQVVITASLLFVLTYLIAGHYAGWSWQACLTISLALALSSTAIALQTLGERGEMGMPVGRKGFAILLFQDITVIPILVFAPLLAMTLPAQELKTNAVHGAVDDHGARLDLTVWMDILPSWAVPLVILGAIGIMLLVHRTMLRPILRFVASSHVREIFVGFSIFLVISAALVMTLLDISAALGGLLAGMVLADSEYRHEIEADLQPIKGLLLGVFFITTGANIDLGYVLQHVVFVLFLVVALITLKGAILWLLASLRKLPAGEQLTLTVLLAQGGEFAFVLLITYVNLGLITPEQSSLLTAVVSLSMLATPLLLIFADRVIRPRLKPKESGRKTDVEDEGADVIIAGFGRFGQIIGRMLISQGIKTTILDHDSQHIDFVAKFGSKIFYGDATRLDLLRSAGIGSAKVLVIAIDDTSKSVELALQARRYFPKLKILARAHNRTHAYELIAAGVDDFWRETFESSVMLAGSALRHLGFKKGSISALLEHFMAHDRKDLHEAVDIYKDEAQLHALALRSRDELENLLISDAEHDEDPDASPPR